MNTLALILAGGRGSRLDILSRFRAKPSLPFGGRYRLIDFSLSNCVNSNIYQIGVLTKYLPLSLNAHLGIGEPWDLDRKQGGITLLHPRTGRREGWDLGTAHAVYQNLDFISSKDVDYVIILSGDHVYKMDYAKMIKYHIEKGADLTIATQTVPMKEANRFGILDTDQEMRVLNFEEKPEYPTSNLASMGIYVFNKQVLIEKLKKYCRKDKVDFGYHIIPLLIDEVKTCAYEYNGYWQDVGTLNSFWKANLDLLNSETKLDLDGEWKIYTRDKIRPPAKFGVKAEISKSLIADGTLIKGKVRNSVIFPGVVIEEGVLVEDSIIFADTRIEKGTTVNNCLIDEEVVIGANSYLGFGRNIVGNTEKPDLLRCGLSVIGQEARIPAKTKLGRNCRVLPRVNEDNFHREVIFSGSTIGKSRKAENQIMAESRIK